MTDQITPSSSINYRDEVQQGSARDTADKPLAPVILVITRNGRLTDAVTDYALSVADRLSYRLLVVDIDTLPQLRSNRQRSAERAATIAETMLLLKQKTDEKNIAVDLVVESGSVSKVINNICHIVKRVKFAVIDKGIKLEIASSRSPVPVFHVVSDHIHVARSGTRYRQTIDTINFPKRDQKVSQAWLKTLLLAVGITALYGILGTQLRTIMDFWTRGGPYAVLPPLTAIVFCCLQIAFANALRNALAATHQNAQLEKDRRRCRAGKQSARKQHSPTRHSINLPVHTNENR